MDIARQLIGILIHVNQDSSKATLQQMAGALSLSVKIRCVSPIDMAHDLRKITCGGFQQQMIMITQYKKYFVKSVDLTLIFFSV